MGISTGFSAAALGAGQQTLTGMAAGSRIRTLDGLLPVEYLEPGDRIVTRSGARPLVSVSVCQSKVLDIVRLRASALGHDRPEDDLVLGPGQPVILRDWRARVLHVCDVAAVPSERLVDGEFVLRETRHDVRLFTLRFAEVEVIWAERTEVFCPAVTVSSPADGAPASAVSIDH